MIICDALIYVSDKMKNYEDLELIYTSEENDNVRIWACNANWTQAEVNDAFSDYDHDSRKLILKYLTSEPHIAEGMNLIVN